MHRGWIAVLLMPLLAAAAAGSDGLQDALDSITEPELRSHIRFLSHDLLEGRAPASRGGRLAQLYITGQFERIGLEPLDSGHLQRVPLVGAMTDPSRSVLRFETESGALAASYGDDAVFWSGRADSVAEVTGELVFAGYGVRAPEFDWDDFQGLDLEGKVLLVLINDPPTPPEEPELFGGRDMTYYGRWSYKLEEAARQGAAGALIIHSTAAAGYSWDVVRSSWADEQLSLPRTPNAPERAAVEGWIHHDFARRLLDRAGISLDELYVRAARRDFQPIETDITVRADLRSRTRRLESANVVGRLPGSDETLRDETVVMTAHYDHLGIGRAVDGDSIYNGAYDNASGVGLLLEVADAFARLEPAPRRSVLFIATAAEEAGLLGSEHYVRNPLVPLEQTVANINIDGANLWGETDDVVTLGGERSTLGRVVRERAGELGLNTVPERAPENGFFFRSDHFSFARAGVPAVGIEHGLDYRGRPATWGVETLERYDAERYHRPADEFDPDFDLAGAVQQARVALLAGYDAAQADTTPRWYDDGRVESAAARLGTGSR